MSANVLSWVCIVLSLSVAGLHAGNRRRVALWLSVFNQVPWAVLGLVSGQWGLVAGAGAFAGIAIWGLFR